MGFLIKSAFWLSLVLLVIPFDIGDSHQTGQVGAVQAFLAAGEAASDVAGMCQRKPEVCTVGKSALQTIGVRARVGAKYAYEMLDQHFSDNNPVAKTDSVLNTESAATDSSIKTGTIRKRAGDPVRNASPDTDPYSQVLPTARPTTSD